MKIKTLVLLLCGVFVLSSCEDPVPDDYTPELVVEGFVIAGQPLNNVKVFLSQPIQDTFNIETAMVRDAEVLVLENGTPVSMIYVASENGGYYAAADTSFRAKFNTTYDLTVRASGFTASAIASTKGEFGWTVPPKEIMQYPGAENETKEFDSLKVSWEPTPGTSLYVLAIQCQDTSGYGEYLSPPTSDTNRRVRNEDFDAGTLVARERTQHGVAFVANTPTVWRAFKWFGQHSIKVYAGDQAFQNWFSQVGFGRRSSYDYRRSNIKGGLGVWAGASVIEAPALLLKDKP